MKTLYLLYVIGFLLASCKKENIATETPMQQQRIKEFDTCNCAANVKGGNEEYIKAIIDGVPVCFDQMPAITDTFANLLSHGYILRDTGNQYYDNVSMIRNAANSNWEFAIYLENTYALSKKYPYNLPRPNSEICEIGEMQINDMSHYISCTWCSENSYNYYAAIFAGGISMTVNSFDNNYFEGTFQGYARTGSGKGVSITNGVFRIRLIVIQSNIDVRNQ
ncbi:MAG TPA: hypothetical protein VIJ57_07260 [Hanamia sp.]